MERTFVTTAARPSGLGSPASNAKVERYSLAETWEAQEPNHLAANTADAEYPLSEDWEKETAPQTATNAADSEISLAEDWEL